MSAIQQRLLSGSNELHRHFSALTQGEAVLHPADFVELESEMSGRAMYRDDPKGTKGSTISLHVSFGKLHIERDYNQPQGYIWMRAQATSGSQGSVAVRILDGHISSVSVPAMPMQNHLADFGVYAEPKVITIVAEPRKHSTAMSHADFAALMKQRRNGPAPVLVRPPLAIEDLSDELISISHGEGLERIASLLNMPGRIHYIEPDSGGNFAETDSEFREKIRHRFNELNQPAFDGLDALVRGTTKGPLFGLPSGASFSMRAAAKKMAAGSMYGVSNQYKDGDLLADLKRMHVDAPYSAMKTGDDYADASAFVMSLVKPRAGDPSPEILLPQREVDAFKRMLDEERRSRDSFKERYMAEYRSAGNDGDRDANDAEHEPDRKPKRR